MIESLKLLNVEIRIDKNKDVINIKGKKDYFNKVTLSSYNDHRIVMALSIFATLNKGCITINDVDCISKSAPEFFYNLINGCKNNSIQITY